MSPNEPQQRPPSTSHDAPAPLHSPSPPPPTHPPSLLRRLSTSVPEHTTHILERLLSPNKVMFSLPHNDPHDEQASSIPDSPHPHSDSKHSTPAPTAPAKKQRRVSFSIGVWREKQKHVSVVETEVPASPGEKDGDGKKDDWKGKGKETDFGVPLCREAEIEKWHIGEQERQRRGSWH